ncbi:hypothetical protein JCM16303_000322 [Sporobolomyces ruberrimus]
MSQRASSRIASSPSSSTIAESYPAPSLTDTTTSSSDTTSIPSLSSLLQQTAESLSSRTKTAPPSKPSPTPTIPTSPSILSHPSAPTYLSSLLSLPLPSLLSLPKNLASLSTTLDSDLSSLAFTRYPSFLLSHSSSQNISQSFDSLSESLSSLLDSTTSLEHATSTFNEGLVKDLKLKGDELSLVRERLEPLEELLEVPLVVRQCIRTGNWNEAISISKRIKDLRNHYFNSTTTTTTTSTTQGGGGGEGILERIEKEVEKELLGLKIKVFESFEERQLKLPGAVRGIGILRKLHLATTQEGGGLGWEEEEGLRIVFLSARWKCFEKELERVESQMVACGIQLDRRGDQKVTTIPLTTKKGGTSGRVGVEENDERTRWIKRWIEIWREIVGETIQIYSEVFLSNTTSTSPASPQFDAFLNPIPSLSPHAPLSLFLSTSLSSLSSTLTSALPSLTSTSSLSSLLTQLTYCSHSFTRHGLSFDLPLQLSHLFSLRILRIQFLEWELAGKNWESEWRQGWNKSGSTALSMTTSRSRRNGRIPLKDWLVVPEGVSQLLSTRTPPTPTTFKKEEEGGWSPQPCPTLALLPPLTHFLNSYINSLNALRLLPSREVYESLVRGQGKEFERSSRVLEAFVEAWYGSFVASSTPNLGSKAGSSGASVFSNGGNEEERSEEESLIERERDEEKEVVVRSLSWFGRELLPWLRNALAKGVYAENEEKEGREEDGYVEARKRVERLIAKIEGREWVDPDLERPMTTSDSQGITNGNGGDHASANDDVEKKETETDLPILEIPAGPLESLESPSKESANGRLPTEEEEEERPIDFTDEPPLPTDEPSLDLTPTANEEPNEAVEDSNKPYFVDDVAPPPPVPLSESEVGEQNGFEPEERGDTSKIGGEGVDGLAPEEPPL